MKMSSSAKTREKSKITLIGLEVSVQGMLLGTIILMGNKKWYEVSCD